MEKRRVDGGVRRRIRTLKRADLRTLLRSRAVQAALVVTAGAQVFAVVSGRDGGPADAARLPLAAAPAAVEQVATQAVASTAGESESQKLAKEYRAKGFRVSDALAAEIVEAAGENGISAEVAFGLVATESEFKPTARSPVGAIGLAQLMPATARLLRPGTTTADLRDPEINLSLGFRFLRDMIRHYDGDTTLALLAYNRGPATVDRILARGGDPDNGYADKVLGRE